MFNVVLIEPEIHFNTGNVGRTCVGLGATLHLVEPLGFSLDAAQVRRAGLDYWPKLDLRVHPGLESFERSLPRAAEMFLFSSEASARPFWEAPFTPAGWLLFGKESTGLPRGLKERHPDRLYRIPHSREIRSLNLSTAAGIALYEAARKCGYSSAGSSGSGSGSAAGSGA